MSEDRSPEWFAEMLDMAEPADRKSTFGRMLKAFTAIAHVVHNDEMMLAELANDPTAVRAAEKLAEKIREIQKKYGDGEWAIVRKD